MQSIQSSIGKIYEAWMAHDGSMWFDIPSSTQTDSRLSLFPEAPGYLDTQ